MKQVTINGQYNSALTIGELRELLQQGNEEASDLLWELARADERKVWDYVGIEDIEQRLDGMDLDLTAQDVLDYMKNDYNLIDAGGEADYAIETLWNEKISNN